MHKCYNVELSKNWFWKEKTSDDDILALLEIKSFNTDKGWKTVHRMPSEVHVELLKLNEIPDPYLGLNEHDIQWVGEREWLYASTFTFDVNIKEEHTELIFEGLDTICTIYLNGSVIMEADNQFRTYCVKLDSNILRTTNVLLLHFKSAKTVAQELEKQYGVVRAGSCNLGDPSRVYVRKAQYDWRWDWGPEIMTVGPYRPIRFLTYTARFLDVHIHAAVSSSLVPSLTIDLSVIGKADDVEFIQVYLSALDVTGEKVISKEDNEMAYIRQDDIAFNVPFPEQTRIIEWVFEKNEVELWWPIGYGDQNLYKVEIVMVGENSLILDEASETVGFRRVELVQEPLKEDDRHGKGSTFLFEVNNVRMFIGGSNWIPADNFLTTITPAKYRAWLELLRDGNQNMVRLWGGGVYEPDIFYDICDELGILVWQDFQFACGVYPAHESFLENVREEAEDNLKRLRHHPSVALFCGNNEDYQQVLQWGGKAGLQTISDRRLTHYIAGITELPARKIYEEILPEVVDRLTSGTIPYHRGSPYGGEGWDTADPTIGDIHQWDVWAGTGRNYQDYDLMGGRFVSEFGVPAMPDIKTIDYWLDGNTAQRYAQSKMMAQHNKAGSHERRFAILMNENIRLTGDFETHAYHTQIMQSEAISWAYRAWRREWRGRGREFTAGAIVWQLNDCWPVTSWAIVDYFLRPKAAYYTIARELRPITVGILRTVTKNRENDRPRQFYEFGAFQSVSAQIDIWGTNSTLKARSVQLYLECFDLDSDWRHQEVHEYTLLPNQSTELLSIPCPEPERSTKHIKNSSYSIQEVKRTWSHSVVVSARLLDAESGGVLARHVDWPQPYRYLIFPDPGLDVKVEGEIVNIDVKRPVKGLMLDVYGVPDVKWSDNALDVIPGDPQSVSAKGIGGRMVNFRYMGKDQLNWND